MAYFGIFTNRGFFDLYVIPDMSIFTNICFWTQVCVWTNVRIFSHNCFFDDRRFDFHLVFNCAINNFRVSTNNTVRANHCISLDLHSWLDNGIRTDIDTSINICRRRINECHAINHVLLINTATHQFIRIR